MHRLIEIEEVVWRVSLIYFSTSILPSHGSNPCTRKMTHIYIYIYRMPTISRVADNNQAVDAPTHDDWVGRVSLSLHIAMLVYIYIYYAGRIYECLPFSCGTAPYMCMSVLHITSLYDRWRLILFSARLPPGDSSNSEMVHLGNVISPQCHVNVLLKWHRF